MAKTIHFSVKLFLFFLFFCFNFWKCGPWIGRLSISCELVSTESWAVSQAYWIRDHISRDGRGLLHKKDTSRSTALTSYPDAAVRKAFPKHLLHNLRCRAYWGRLTLKAFSYSSLRFRKLRESLGA